MRYAISDIHGCLDTFKALLEKIGLSEEDKIYLLGDYVDRGRDSKGVLDLVMSMPNAIPLKGNHEEFMVPENESDAGLWIMNGGYYTLDSFGWRIERKYIEFCQSLPLIAELPDFYLCHSGCIKISDPMSTPKDILLWERNQWIYKPVNGRKVICGHTPTKIDDIERSLENNKIIIDNGCYHRGKGYGNLVALDLDNMKITVQENIDWRK